MKLLKLLTLSLFSSTLFAQTTMCFKENHNSMATIESTKLDGGECKSAFSLIDMKNQGWIVNDIKITPKNDTYSFIYILKKGQNTTTTFTNQANISQEQLEANIVKRLEAKKQKEIKEKKIKEDIEAKKAGKKLYENNCKSCHGEKAEKSAYNVSNPLKDMSLEDMQYAINRYTNDSEYGNGYQVMMRPIAANITSTKLKQIKAYLDSLK